MVHLTRKIPWFLIHLASIVLSFYGQSIGNEVKPEQGIILVKKSETTKVGNHKSYLKNGLMRLCTPDLDSVIVTDQAANIVRKVQAVAFSSDTTKDVDTTYMEIPMYDVEKPQALDVRKARLHYQSRKRGMLENDLLLSTFAKKYLDGFSEKQTMMYDRLINSPSNDWDIFHWIVQKKPTPKEFDNEIMDLLKKHAKNEDRAILRQPPLH